MAITLTEDSLFYQIMVLINGKANTSHTHTASEITDFSTAADTRITAQKGQNSGLCPLDSGGKVAAAYLPSYVDDVLEYANLAGFPVTGETGKIYVDLATGKIHRWSGSVYVEISPSVGSTDSLTEGSTNLYFTNERAQDAVGNILSSEFVYDDNGNAISLRARSFATPSRSSGSAFQVSATRDSEVSYRIPVTSVAALLTGSRAQATLQYADDSGFTTNVVTVDADDYGIGSGLVVTGYGTLKLKGKIPAGKYVKITTTQATGTPTIGTIGAQEVLL